MKQGSVLIGFCGDVMIGRMVDEVLNHRLPQYLWGDVLPLLQEMDLNIINLEAALTTSARIVPKVFNFKADPQKIALLTMASIDLVNLANNHILDYSEEGLLETLKTLDEAKILHVGAGRNIAEARRPAIINRNGIKIGVLGYTDNEPDWVAAETSAGINYINVGDLAKVKRDLDTIRHEVDLVIVSLHWGPNMRTRPPPYFVDFAHQLIDNGVDIIHGHSAHIFQGVEIYKNKLIMFDTGDFVDDYAVDPILRNDQSFFFIVEVSKNGPCSLQLIPTIIQECQVNRANKEDIPMILARMQKLSAERGTVLEERQGCLFKRIKNDT